MSPPSPPSSPTERGARLVTGDLSSSPRSERLPQLSRSSPHTVPRTVDRDPPSCDPTGPPSSSPLLRSQPSRRYFYIGPPSRPERLASTSPLPHFTGPGIAPYLRWCLLEGIHPLAAVWERGVGPAICKTIKAAVAADEWVVDAIRIGVGREVMRPVIWIGVPKGSITSQGAEDLVHEVVRICRGYGIQDVESELRVAQLVRTTSMLDPNRVSRFVMPWADPFCRSVGTPFTCWTDPTLDAPHSLGSGAIYLSVPGHSKLFLLTAAHCVVPKSDIHLGTMPHETQLATPVHIHTIETFSAARADLAETIDEFRKIQRGSTSRIASSLDDDKDFFQAQAAVAGSMVPILEKWQDIMLSSFGDAALRQFGTVHFAPPVMNDVRTHSTSHLPYGFTQDIGLIETDIWVDSPEALNVNTVSLRFKADQMILPERIAVNGVYSQVELDAGGLKVLKRGATTGLTYGITGALKSFTMMDGVIAMQIPVQGKDDEPFTKGGDSGSVAMGLDGKLCGLVHAGAGNHGRFDITYLTPMWWVSERLDHYGFRPTIV